MTTWSHEIKDLERLHESFKGQLPEVEKELGQLLNTEDANVIMLYSRRCLEVIITNLCESELNRPRKTEPLKGIIDKLNREDKVPSHLITSMHSLVRRTGFPSRIFEYELEGTFFNDMGLPVRLPYALEEESFNTDMLAEAKQNQNFELTNNGMFSTNGIANQIWWHTRKNPIPTEIDVH
jgi:hypothetical protein